jgi:hypothetical protein
MLAIILKLCGLEPIIGDMCFREEGIYIEAGNKASISWLGGLGIHAGCSTASSLVIIRELVKLGTNEDATLIS